MLSLCLLGRPRLARDGVELTIKVRKAWALLLLLALHDSLPRSRLVAWLWPQLDESTGRRNLRRELARLGDVGAEGLVRSDQDFLHLNPAAQRDLTRFESAREAARLDEALALWQGTLADGLSLDDSAPFEEWLALERQRWHARWRDALEGAAVAAATAGDAALAERHWMTLLADDPLQERHHAALIRRHLATGRREAALAQYERCRQVLADELGLAPMASTQALWAQARREGAVSQAPPATAAADVSPHSSADTARPLLPKTLPFVGREAEVAELEAAWRRGGWICIAGVAGVGKTRLAQDFCAAHGAYALSRSLGGDRDLPYASFVRALRVLAGPSLPALPAWVNAELARVMPELGPAAQPLASAEERLRFYEACAVALRQAAEGNFDAVILDDLHDADEPSLALLAWLVRRLRDERPDDPLRWLMLSRPGVDLSRLNEGASARLELAPLADGPVFELVRELSGGGTPQRFAARLQQATAGNPFFIAETLRHLAESGELLVDTDGAWSTRYDDATDDYRELPLPATVRDAVLARVRRLGDAARRLLEAASLAQEPFAPPLLAAACALSELEATAALEEALGAAMLREVDGGLGYAFSHDLAHHALAAALAPERRRLVHRRLALASLATGGRAALTAMHFELSGESERAVAFRLSAGDEAAALYAGTQAQAHWLAALASAGEDRMRLQLRLRLASSLIDHGQQAQANAHLEEARSLWIAAELSTAERGDTACRLVEIESACGEHEAALARLEALLPTLTDRPLRLRALRLKSQRLSDLLRYDESRAVAEAALEDVGEDRHERANILDSLFVIEFSLGRAGQALELARQALALRKQVGERRMLQRGHSSVGLLLSLCGAADEGLSELQRALTMAEEMHLVERQREVLVNMAKIHGDRGDGVRVLELVEQAWNLAPDFPKPMMRQYLLQARLYSHSLLGQIGQALALAEQALSEAQAGADREALQYAVLGLLTLLVMLGDHERARALLVSMDQHRDLRQMGVKLHLQRAFLEVREGHVVAARAALAAVGDPARLEDPQDRGNALLHLAAVLRAESDAAGAMQALGSWQEEPPNVEWQAHRWAAILRGSAQLGTLAESTWAEARAELAKGTMPALDALELQQALMATAPDEPRRAQLSLEVDAAVARIAESLADWPEHRKRFLAAVVPARRGSGSGAKQARGSSAPRRGARRG